MPNIKLKDQNGEFVTYNGVNVIQIPDEQGEPQLFRQPSGKAVITGTQETDVENYATAQVVDANLVPENIAAGVTVLGIAGTHAGGGTKPEETFDVTPTRQAQQITPTSGSVFSGGRVRGYVPNLQPKSVTPDDSQQVVSYDAPYDGLERVSIQPIPKATHINRQEFCEHYGRPGAVIVSPDGSGITVYETVKEGSSFDLTDLGWESMAHCFTAEDAAHEQVADYMDNAAGLLSDPDGALRARFDAIFANADRVDFCGYPCAPIAMPEAGDDPYTWDQLINALYASSHSIPPKLFDYIPMQWVIADGETTEYDGDLYADPFVAKFPFVWKAMRSLGGEHHLGYMLLQDATEEMEPLPSGYATYPGQGAYSGVMIAAVNGIAMYGTSDFIFIGQPNTGRFMWYSFGSQTIPAAFLDGMLQQVGMYWAFGNVTLADGWNITYEIGAGTNTTVPTDAATVTLVIEFLGGGWKLPTTAFDFDSMDACTRSLFAEAVEPYYEETGRFSLELYLTCYGNQEDN